MLLTTYRHYTYTGIDLYINGSKLPEVSTAKDLGITFDSHLFFTTHISSITCTANQRVNLLFRSFLTRNRSMLVKAYVTYVRPILEYNSVVWSPYKIGDIPCIEKVQRSFTKRLPDLNNLTYRERLAVTNLDSLN